MTATELRNLLEPFGIRPVHDRGQHFLLDDSVVEKMVAAAAVAPGDAVTEIGPGPGILTEKLLAAGANVTAVEIDLKLRQLLMSRFGDNPRFRLLEGDALSFANAELAGSPAPAKKEAPKPYKLVANLPYAITTQVLRKFLLEAPAAASVTVMIQREVADRILAAPKRMSSLTVLVQAYAHVSRVVNVPAGAFLPPPKVDSAVIHIERKSEDTLAGFFGKVSPDAFFRVVQAAFAERRKQLRNTLKSVASSEKSLNEAFLQSGVAPSRRPEELSLEEWRLLAERLTS